MSVKIFRAVVMVTAISAGVAGLGQGFAAAQATPTQDPGAQGQQQGQSGRGRGMGFGGFPGGGRGILGTVTEVTSDHYTIKTDSGEMYTVHYSVNTRMMKQG